MTTLGSSNQLAALFLLRSVCLNHWYNKTRFLSLSSLVSNIYRDVLSLCRAVYFLRVAYGKALVIRKQGLLNLTEAFEVGVLDAVTDTPYCPEFSHSSLSGNEFMYQLLRGMRLSVTSHSSLSLEMQSTAVFRMY